MQNNQNAASGHKSVFILGPAYPYRGGIASFGERLAQAFLHLEHRVHLFTFTLQYPGLFFPGSTQFSSDLPPNLPITRLFNSINPANWYQSGKLLRQLKPDVVVWQYWLPYLAPCMGTVNRILAQNNHTRIVGLIHNLAPHEKSPADRLLNRYFVQSCHGFVTLSGAVQEEVKWFNGSKPVLFIPHPVYDNFGEKVDKEEARRFLNIPPDAKLVLFFGIIRPYKGLDVLLRAVANDRVRQSGIHLLVAGEYYHDQSYYTQLIADLQLQNTVTLHPQFIPNQEVKYYFCAADMVVQPYRTATQSGISQMAYQFERPMLVTDVGGLAEIVPHGEAGYVVKPESPEAIADALLDFYDNHREAGFSAAAARHKNRFTWDAMASGILQAAML
ncbi:glycosyl transferase family 1 [Sphingobacteriales bacterium UPWRP_1]|nr:hypothetical protein BVG80_10925 [Sphingobacteriales bacterium TSM_CSM]PSJ77452.1 glycosyl transferase family 1 [Sphingobacteriales bacterium UPWRP_1]